MDRIYEEVLTLKRERDHETGKIWREKYFNNAGELHGGDNLPSVIEYDLETSEPVLVMYHKNGKLHRDDGSASYLVDPATGVVTNENWYLDGEPHRNDGQPSTIQRNSETGEVVYQDFYCFGRKTRPAINLVKEDYNTSDNFTP